MAAVHTRNQGILQVLPGGACDTIRMHIPAIEIVQRDSQYNMSVILFRAITHVDSLSILPSNLRHLPNDDDLTAGAKTWKCVKEGNCDGDEAFCEPDSRPMDLAQVDSEANGL